jgi:hypothetical protein
VPKYQVPITGPDGTSGTITVNASDEAAAIENASQGGNTPSGGATQVDAGPNAATSSGGGGGSSTYNTGGAGGAGKPDATTGASQANPGTMFGFKGGSAGNTAEDRVKASYEAKDNETLPQWMQRVMRQGTRDFGGVLSPDASNPYGRTPYAQWFQNRYADVVPANIVLSKLLNNTGNDQDFAQTMQGGMRDFLGTGTGRGFGMGTQEAGQNMGSLNDLLNAFNAGNTGNLSPDQMTMLGSINDSPQQQMAMMNAQLSGGIGANPFAAGYARNLQAQMMNDYYDDIVGHAPGVGGNGTFLNSFMKKLNMA